VEIDDAADDPDADAHVSVLVVDDHTVFAQALTMALDAQDGIEVVAAAPSLAAARSLLSASAVDVVLLDVRLPDGDGISAIPSLLSAASAYAGTRVDQTAPLPAPQIVVLTAAEDEAVVLAALEAGAAGFVVKNAGLPDVVAAVRAAGREESVISAALLARLLPRLTRTQRGVGSDLTGREREVLALVAEGMSNAAIARELVVSPHTVRNHLASLSAKLGTHSKLESLAVAVREGLVPGRR
jgi:DNA-binding NarL/FixJ family response regulator